MALENLEIRLEDTGMRGKYSIAMPNGEESELTYVRVAPDHLIADHTFVPVPYRGEGVGERMVARLIADARATGARITPTCWFVADEFKRHGAEWEDVLRR
jgi:predicted GNAT family acetyltransferase